MGAQELAERLRKLDACAASDAMDRLGLRGAVIGISPVVPGSKIAGPVVTLKLKPKGQEESTRHLGTAAIEAATPGDVIVVDHRGRADVAGWGGILARAAQQKGVAGVIVDGAARDADESRELGFPVFARGAVPVTARGRVIEQSTNELVEIGAVSVRPGDLVIADGSGIVFIPAERAEEVIAAAEEIADREAQMAQAVMEGQSVVEVMGRRYETMLGRR